MANGTLIDILKKQNPEVSTAIDRNTPSGQVLPAMVNVPEHMSTPVMRQAGQMMSRGEQYTAGTSILSAPSVPAIDQIPATTPQVAQPSTPVEQVDAEQLYRQAVDLQQSRTAPNIQQAVATPQLAQPVAPHQQAATEPRIGGMISWGDPAAGTGQVQMYQQGGGEMPEVNQNQLDEFYQRSSARGASDVSISGPTGQAVDPNINRYSPQFQTPEMRANIAAGRPPNVSAAQVAQAQQAEQQMFRDIQTRQARERVDNLVRDFERSLGGTTNENQRAQNAAAVAQYRAQLEGQIPSMVQASNAAGQKPMSVSDEIRIAEFRQKQQESRQEQAIDAQKAAGALQGLKADLDLVREKGEDIKSLTLRPRTEGLLAKALATISPTSTAAELERASGTLTGDAFIKGMRVIKEFGGGLGSVTEVEGLKVERAQGAIFEPGMSDQERRAAVDNYLKVREDAYNRVRDAFVRQYGEGMAQQYLGEGSSSGSAGGSPYENDQDYGDSAESYFSPSPSK